MNSGFQTASICHFRQGGGAAFLVGGSIDEMAFQSEAVVDVGVDRGELLQGLRDLNLSIARSRRRNDKWLFSTRLLAQRLTSCFPRCLTRPSLRGTSAARQW